MSKQIRLAIIALTGVSLFFAGLSRPSANSTRFSAQPQSLLRLCGELSAIKAGAVARPSGRASQRPVATTKQTRNAALVAATNEVLKETSEIRQLSILRPVRSSAQSRAEIERMIMQNLDEETTPAQIHATEVTLKKLGLALPDFQYRALMIRLLTEQVAGYYDPKTREFHLADWIDIDAQKPVMAHELTHALQDQHFNLRRFEHWPKGDSDAELAVRALIEGDATLAMALYVANSPLRLLALLKSLGTSSMSSVELDKAPRAVRESLLFPYQEGLGWTQAMYRRGGWNGVSQAFTSLPQSTEQILHPEKYFAHEAPVKVTLPDITSVLNAGRASANSGRWAVSSGQRRAVKAHHASSTYTWTSLFDCPLPTAHCPLFAAHRPLLTGGWISSPAPDTRSPAPASWRRLDYDVQGEWGFYLILDQFLKSPAESRRAAAGWGGDRYAVYEGPKGEVLIASLSTWDTENDAREFFDAYVKRTGLRYPGVEKLDSVDPATRNSKLETRNSEAFSFRTSEGLAVIEVRGSRVLILEGIPDRVDPNALLRSLRQ